MTAENPDPPGSPTAAGPILSSRYWRSALLAAGFTLRAREQGARRPAERASLQARMLEVALAGPRAFTGRSVAAKEWTKAETQLKEPWDRALLTVLRAELGDADQAARRT
ncbi:MAG: hypothetical protein IPO28_15530 [Holophagaceae bacterium]|nr:hypothetical protein [Holophagaceae bacterium]